MGIHSPVQNSNCPFKLYKYVAYIRQLIGGDLVAWWRSWPVGLWWWRLWPARGGGAGGHNALRVVLAGTSLSLVSYVCVDRVGSSVLGTQQTVQYSVSCMCLVVWQQTREGARHVRPVVRWLVRPGLKQGTRLSSVRGKTIRRRRRSRCWPTPTVIGVDT
jgi:hypothetical protein